MTVKENKRAMLRLYFKSGSKIDIECDSYEFKYNCESLEFSSYKFNGLKPMVSFVPSQLEAYVVLREAK